MNKSRHTNRLKMSALLGVILSGGILVTGCGQAPQDAKVPAEKVKVETPAVQVTPVAMPEKPAIEAEETPPPTPEAAAPTPVPPAPAQSPVTPEAAPAAAAPVIPAKVRNDAEFVSLYAAQQENKKSGESSKDVDKDFAAKWKAATAVMVPKTLIKGLDLLAVDTRATGPKEYTFSFLLHTTADLDTDYHLSVTGKVDPSNAQYITPSKPGTNHVSWPLLLYNNPTSKWKADEYHVATLKVETELIPYDLSVALQTRDKEKKWTGNPGNRVELGWQTDANEFVKLSLQEQALKKAKKLSKTASEALTSKWKALTANMEPKPLIEGLDLLAVDTQATGPKEYTFSFLLHTTAALDTDYHLSVMGKVDPSFAKFITPTKPGTNHVSWPLFLYDNPTSEWKAGEYHVVQLKVATDPIPYDLSVALQTRDADKKWTGNPGNRVQLGWQADVSE